MLVDVLSESQWFSNLHGGHARQVSHPRAKGQVANLGIQRQVKLHGFAIEAQHPDLGIFQ